MRNTYDIHGDIILIHLRHKSEMVYAIADIQDLDKLQRFDTRWYLSSNGYAVGNLNNGTNSKTTMHRYLMGVSSPDDIVDHINHNKLDNRTSCNLRIVTKGENIKNKLIPRSDNTSGCTGVSWDKRRQKWIASISIGKGKKKYLGQYAMLEDAIKARKDAEKSLYENDDL